MNLHTADIQIVKDFLYHCFQKDPNLRVSAKKLLRHPWMLSTRKNTEPSPPTTQPHTRQNTAPSAAPSKSLDVPPKSVPLVDDASQRTVQLSLPTKTPSSVSAKAVGRSASAEEKVKAGLDVPHAGSGADMMTVRPKKPMTVYDEAVLKVQEWNEALNGMCLSNGRMVAQKPRLMLSAAPKANDKTRRLPLPEMQTRKPRSPLYASFAGPSMPTRPSADSLTAQPSSDSLNAQLGEEEAKGRAAQPVKSALAVDAARSHGPSAGGPSTAGLLYRGSRGTDVLSRAQEKEGEDNWDEDFADAFFSTPSRKSAVCVRVLVLASEYR